MFRAYLEQQRTQQTVVPQLHQQGLCSIKKKDKVVQLGSYLSANAEHTTDANDQSLPHAIRPSLKKQHGTKIYRQEQHWLMSTGLTVP